MFRITHPFGSFLTDNAHVVDCALLAGFTVTPCYGQNATQVALARKARP